MIPEHGKSFPDQFFPKRFGTQTQTNPTQFQLLGMLIAQVGRGKKGYMIYIYINNLNGGKVDLQVSKHIKGWKIKFISITHIKGLRHSDGKLRWMTRQSAKDNGNGDKGYGRSGDRVTD